MTCWSAENATKAYLRSLKMGKTGKELDAVEFISALAAGNSAQLMVMVSACSAGSIALSLVAAAYQTGGQVVWILPTESASNASRSALGPYADRVTFVSGDARTLLLNEYKEADFVLIDCNIDDREGVFRAAKKCPANHAKGLILGYNAFHKGSWACELTTRLLPIGDELLVTRIRSSVAQVSQRKSSRWVVKVDEYTGEEHAYRVASPPQET